MPSRPTSSPQATGADAWVCERVQCCQLLPVIRCGAARDFGRRLRGQVQLHWNWMALLSIREPEDAASQRGW
jgi:hypothetical protein